MRPSPVLVGVDTGGTFTDLVALVGGELRVLKVPSTPRDPAAAVLSGLGTLLGDAGRARLHYGSTVATNALLERRGARVVLLTTEGFEDILEIGRQVRPELYVLEPFRPPPLVPRARRHGVHERVLADGRIEVPLGTAAIRRAVAAVARRRAEAVAICLLHSYAAPRNERRLGRALAGRGLHVTLSHHLVHEYREYERLSTTVVNAYVGPVMARHLRALTAGVPGGVRVMQSSGGLMEVRAAAAEAVRTVLSGPAGGVVGATERARRGGFRRIITLDMGGTSTDVSVVDGVPAYRTDAMLAELPLRVPSMDIHTVGAGGGSLARIDAGGALRVGPESAGADPGPACFGRGTAATLTDAHLVLGRLVETEVLGGELTLDRARAVAAIAPVAQQLGRSIEATATAMVAVANAAMGRALRVITVERGTDPRGFTLVAFGGAGGLHAAELAAELRIRRVYVPRQPGLLSAWGVLTAETVRDFSRTLRLVMPPDRVLTATFRGLVTSARRALAREGVRRPFLERTLEVRYVGQGYEVQVPFRRGWVRAFHRLHARRFGHAEPGRALEVVTLRLRARGGGSRVPAERLARAGRIRPLAMRRVRFVERPRLTPVYRRHDLPVARRVRGPAIVCEYSATTLVPPGWWWRIDRAGGLVLEMPGT